MSLRRLPEAQHTIITNLGTVANVFAPVVAGQRVAVVSAILSNITATAVTVTFQDTTGVAVSSPISVPANSSVVLPVQNSMDPWFVTPLQEITAGTPPAGPTGAYVGMQVVSSAATSINADIYWLQGP